MIKLILDWFEIVKPGARIMHLAPEVGLAKYLENVAAERYEAFDYDPNLFPNLNVKKIDLVHDLEDMPSETYDLVLHSHVMEHLPCDVTSVLFHLHRLVKPLGYHIFSVPIYGGWYSCDFAPLSGNERKARFGQDDHVRRFGRDDLDLTLGKVFKLNNLDLEMTFGREVLEQKAIPEQSWRGYSSHTVFVQRKNDLRLK